MQRVWVSIQAQMLIPTSRRSNAVLVGVQQHAQIIIVPRTPVRLQLQDILPRHRTEVEATHLGRLFRLYTSQMDPRVDQDNVECAGRKWHF